MKRKSKIFLGCSTIMVIAAFTTAILLVMSNTAPKIIEEPIQQKKYVLRPLFGPPTTNKTGLDYVYLVPHQADPGTAYAVNWTGTIYENSTEFNEEMYETTPYSQLFDVLYKVQINWSDGYNTSSSQWDLDFCYFLLTCADLGIAADTNLSEIKIGNNADEMWVHYYANNGGAGYSIGPNEKGNLTAEKLYVLK